MDRLSSISSNDSHSNLGYTTSPIKKYWCHICKKMFTKLYIENIDIQCSECGKTFCEELETEDTNNESHPSHFQPYISPPTNNRNNNNNNNNSDIFNQFMITRNVLRPRTSVGLLDMILNYFVVQRYNQDIENIINHIMLNDPNKYGNPPASKKEVEKLEKITITDKVLENFGVENSCAVCKDEFGVGESCLVMPCKHHFHNDCLLPWLKERNSCPVCRYELPTDDEDFERRKKEKLNVNNNH